MFTPKFRFLFNLLELRQSLENDLSCVLEEWHSKIIEDRKSIYDDKLKEIDDDFDDIKSNVNTIRAAELKRHEEAMTEHRKVISHVSPRRRGRNLKFCRILCLRDSHISR